MEIERDQFKTKENTGNVTNRFSECEFPTCHNCKEKYAKQRAIKETLLEAGMKNGVWTCASCRRAPVD
jgi:hypothetical protein